MNLFDDDNDTFGDFDDFDSDTSDNGDGTESFGTNNGFDNDTSTLDGFSNSDELLNNNDNENLDGSGGIKKTAVIMIIVGVIFVIGVFCLSRVLLNKDKGKTSVSNETSSNIIVDNNENSLAVNSENVPKATVNAQEVMGGNTPQTKPATNTNDSIQNYNDSYWTGINGQDQIAFSEPQEVQFHITDIKHYIAKADGSDNYIVKSTLQGSIAGYSGTFHLDVPYAKGTLLQVGQEFTVYITVGTWNGKTVIGEIKY